MTSVGFEIIRFILTILIMLSHWSSLADVNILDCNTISLESVWDKKNLIRVSAETGFFVLIVLSLAFTLDIFRFHDP